MNNWEIRYGEIFESDIQCREVLAFGQDNARKIIFDEYFSGVIKLMSKFYDKTLDFDLNEKEYTYSYEMLQEYLIKNKDCSIFFERLSEQINLDSSILKRFEDNQIFKTEYLYSVVYSVYGDLLDSIEYDEKDDVESTLIDSFNELLRMLEHEERSLSRQNALKARKTNEWKYIQVSSEPWVNIMFNVEDVEDVTRELYSRVFIGFKRKFNILRGVENGKKINKRITAFDTIEECKINFY